uniref:C2H2-type domain-containing protein n=1 Tax=Timema genevievae TaxID=629358 RepID=A0A7R9JRP3_TIMGE|nr:unnamed protein product [Timema genevievae]
MKFECGVICNKGFVLLVELQAHLKTHIDRKLFTHAEALCVSIWHPTKATTYSSAMSGKSLASKDKLKLHRGRDTGEKPYICDFYGKGFGKNFDMTQQRRVHSGERPYICDIY